jgi:hypothetical protein
MYKQLLTVVDQRVESIDTVVVVATHFGLAHQIGKIKSKVEKEKKVKIILAVQVTDDSPQFMWYVPDADITFVPSEYTKKELIAYGKRRGFPPMQIEVNAYPVSPLLAKKLNRVEFFEKAHQVDPDAKSQIHLCIPISGAAVGLGYFTDLIDSLYSASHRFEGLGVALYLRQYRLNDLLGRRCWLLGRLLCSLLDHRLLCRFCLLLRRGLFCHGAE